MKTMLLIPESQRKGNPCGDESTECPVDPTTDHNHGKDIGYISLQHFRHHGWI